MSYQSDLQDMRDMDMHEKLNLNAWLDVTRVPYGWLYITYETVGGNPTSSTFVPGRPL